MTEHCNLCNGTGHVREGYDGERDCPWCAEQEQQQRDRNMARFLRLAVMRNVLGSGRVDRAFAIEILQGCLTPGDESTRQDDSHMLDWPIEQVRAELDIHPNDLSEEINQ